MIKGVITITGGIDRHRNYRIVIEVMRCFLAALWYDFCSLSDISKRGQRNSFEIISLEALRTTSNCEISSWTGLSESLSVKLF